MHEIAAIVDEQVPQRRDSEHPFDNVAFQGFLQEEFPELVGQVATATRPGVSAQPDEMEAWESAVVQQRKQRRGFEGDWDYLIRLLYEECFSINQNPGVGEPATMHGVAGHTPSGLVSHFFSGNSTGGASISTEVQKDFSGASLQEAVHSLQGKLTNRQIEGFLDVVQMCTSRNDVLIQVHRMGYSGSDVIELVRNGQYGKIFDSIGYRLLAMFKAEPTMLEPIQDLRLKEMLNFRTDRVVSKARFIVKLWGYCQSLLYENGAYRYIGESGVREVLTNLLFCRTHPELQCFFRYLSPSGYINDWMGLRNL
ncbi:MAG: hypothetical protein A3A82_04015 [Candidatus Pacebacteria bacterium RIFCSPLOWO2_01_FULL_47_12]|nr:MAG: hypothetical protein A3J60_02425 [Candidatus Pacebacteria bacterium RIFCSPHIGHO2_02_FULL_46_9]OGJ39352.1 MAG: hypothetical protein A3A82_04015 [Candidatus Pacebacteria bacterium RIFCSPLOWO2_01_FULL_47_12]